jgi:hypothetical protein
MRLRHAAALGISGWYLMMPPSSNLSAPLNQWPVAASFDTADQCESQRMVVYQNMHDPTQQAETAKDVAKEGKTWNRNLAVSRIEAAQCIETDDPRLAK